MRTHSAPCAFGSFAEAFFQREEPFKIQRRNRSYRNKLAEIDCRKNLFELPDGIERLSSMLNKHYVVTIVCQLDDALVVRYKIDLEPKV